jgi:hypothetical protein
VVFRTLPPKFGGPSWTNAFPSGFPQENQGPRQSLRDNTRNKAGRNGNQCCSQG